MFVDIHDKLLFYTVGREVASAAVMPSKGVGLPGQDVKSARQRKRYTQADLRRP
jgi:hypothetical protein